MLLLPQCCRHLRLTYCQVSNAVCCCLPCFSPPPPPSRAHSRIHAFTHLPKYYVHILTGSTHPPTHPILDCCCIPAAGTFF